MTEKTVQKIRQFNRFYLPVFDLLGNRYLGSEYSAAEARVLFEIYEHDGCMAAYISRKMNIDKSYLSRVLKHHEKEGYVYKCPSQTDARAYELHLTRQGAEKTRELIEKSNRQIGNVISSLSQADCEALFSAMDTAMTILGSCVEEEA